MPTPQSLTEIELLLKPVQLGPLSDRPLVSVLTANYNYAHYLDEAIESLRAQSYSNFEMIVCDDGSTDNSCELAQRYVEADPRLKLVKKENGGVASALNAAYRQIRGEIVCLLDADDRFLPDKLEMVVKAFQRNPESGFLNHRMFHIDAEGRRQGITPLLAELPSGWYGPNVVVYGDVPYGLAFGSGVCIRREIANAVFPLPERFRVGADGAITFVAPLMTPIIGVEAPLAEYRYHGRNVTNTNRVTLQSLDNDSELHKIYWEMKREYLTRVNPRLAAVFPRFDQRLGTMVNTYVQARLLDRRDRLSCYKALTSSEGFHTLHPATRWFWRFSILLPLPLFRRALHPSPLKRLVASIMRAVSIGGST